MDVFLNGQFFSPEQAKVRADDASIQHGIGLFETMQVFHGKVFRLAEHMQRLKNAAKELGISPTLKTEPLEEAVEQVITHNKLKQARIRLTLTPGSLSLLSPQNTHPPTPTLLIVPSEPTVYDQKCFEDGITVLVTPPMANPFDPTSGHKTLNYWQRLRTLRQAATAGAGEAIWLNISNHLASGAISNIFLVKNGSLLTPIAHGEEEPKALQAPVLPGTTRQAVLDLAEDLNIPSMKKMLSIEDLLNADEIFLTNSSWLILPVSHVEKTAIGNGEVGPMTAKLRQELLRLIDRECA